MAKRSPPKLPEDPELQRVRYELELARHTIHELMPESIRGLLSAHLHCESHADIYAWRAWVVAKLLCMADTSTAVQPVDGSPRAVCPLCGDHSRSPHETGFALPIGLERHLLGTCGSRQCGVFRCADQDALEAQWKRDQPGYVGPNWSAMKGFERRPAWEEPDDDPPPSAAVLHFPPRPG